MNSNFPRAALAAAMMLALGQAVAANPSLATVAAFAPSTDSIAAAAGDARVIVLRSGIFDPRAQTLDLRNVGAADKVASSRFAIVQFQPGRTGARKALEARGVEFLGYVPNNAYTVRLNGVGIDEIAQDASVRWAGAYQPGMKLDPRLWPASRAALAAKPDDASRHEIEISAFAGESIDRIAAALKKRAASVVVTDRTNRPDAPRLRVDVANADLDALLREIAATEGVAWAAPYVIPRPLNSGAIGAIQGNSVAACAGSGAVCGPTPLWDHQLFGSNQIIGIADSGMDANEAWFTTLDKGAGPNTEVTLADSPSLPNVGVEHPNNKVFAYWVQPGATANDNNNACPGGSPTSFHGTHTSATLAGDAAGTFGAATYLASTPTAANHELSDGMAPNAQILFQDIGNDISGCLAINDLRGTLAQAYAGGARIHSDSWGSSDAGAYASDDNNVDFATWTDPDLIFVVAAGNDGPGGTSIGSPGNAKNALTVGALGHGGSTVIAGFSSRGPTADGRRKPDIVAPGSSTISAAGDATTNATPEAPLTKALSGTSMATPTIAGNSALMRQFFTEGFYPRGTRTGGDSLNPSGMVMKAVLLNGTNPITGATWPNNNIGWGRAWLDSNLWFTTTNTGGDDSRRLRLFERTNGAGLETGEVHTYTIANVGAGSELRATLTWYDPEAANGAALTLVNNLDLEVVGPNAAVYKGNVFTAGVSTPGGNADALNTVEQVRFAIPTAGSYTFRVKGTAIPGNGRPETDRQGYALAVSGAFGLPTQAAFPAPTGLVVASNDASGVGISFASSAGGQGFQLYRANGTCASAAAGDFRLVATGATSPLVDDRTQGGFSYAYKVRGVSNDVEGDASSCVDVVSNDACTLLPTFDQSTTAADGSNASCSVQLSWSAAAASCPTSSGVTYTIRRDTDPYFTAPTTIATGVAATSFNDTTVVDGTPYYYQIVASDSFGNVSISPRTLNVTPSGAAGPDPTAFVDNVDDRTYMSIEAPWRITDTAASDGTLSYHSAGDNASYPSNACAAVETPALTVDASATSLSFKARYDLEFQWDGVVLEASTDDGTTWNDLPPVGGYPSTFAQTQSPPINGCGYATTHGAFNGVSTAASNADPNNGVAASVFKPFTVDLSSFVGQSVRLRWRLSSDPGTEFDGFWLDEVRLGSGPIDVVFRNGFDSVTTDYMCH